MAGVRRACRESPHQVATRQGCQGPSRAYDTKIASQRLSYPRCAQLEPGPQKGGGRVWLHPKDGSRCARDGVEKSQDAKQLQVKFTMPGKTSK